MESSATPYHSWELIVLLKTDLVSYPIDNWQIVWAFQVIPVNQNSYELDPFGRFLFNN